MSSQKFLSRSEVADLGHRYAQQLFSFSMNILSYCQSVPFFDATLMSNNNVPAFVTDMHNIPFCSNVYILKLWIHSILDAIFFTSSYDVGVKYCTHEGI